MRIISGVVVLLLTVGSSIARGGDVKAIVKAGSLVVEDSAEDDVLQIDQVGVGGPDEFRLTPVAPTTLNGGASALVFPGVVKDVIVRHDGGNDLTQVSNAAVPRDLRITAKPQAQLNLGFVACVVGRDVRIDSKAEQTSVDWSPGSSLVGRDLRVKLRGNGVHVVSPSPLEVLGNVRIDGSPGNDLFLPDGDTRFLGDVTFIGRGGDDTVMDEAGTVYGGALKVTGTQGTKSLEIEGDIAGDFSAFTGKGPSQILLTSPQVKGDVHAQFHGQLGLVGCLIGGEVRAKGTGSAGILFDGGTIVAEDVEVRFPFGPNLLEIRDTSLIAGDLDYRGGKHEDVISVGAVSVFGDVTARLFHAPPGIGDGVELIDTLLLGDLRVEGTSGNHRATLDTATVLGEAEIDLGAGDNEFDVLTSELGSLLARAGSGSDDLSLAGMPLATQKDVRILLGGGDNTVAVDQLVCGRHLVIATGGGDDTLTLTNTSVTGATTIDLGGGTNSGP